MNTAKIGIAVKGANKNIITSDQVISPSCSLKQLESIIIAETI